MSKHLAAANPGTTESEQHEDLKVSLYGGYGTPGTGTHKRPPFVMADHVVPLTTGEES